MLNDGKKLIFLFLMTGASLVFAAESCSNIDLNEGENSPFKKIPIYDQDGASTCYSYVAAQYADYYRMKVGKEKISLTSPMYASWLAKFKNFNLLDKLTHNANSGEYVYESFNLLGEYGICTADQVQANIKKHLKITGKSEADILVLLDYVSSKSFKIYFEKGRNQICSDLKNNYNLTPFQASNLVSILKFSPLLNHMPALGLFNLFKDCKEIKVDLPNMVYKKIDSDATADRMISGLLSRELPVSVDLYCSGGMFNSNQGEVVASREESRKDSCGAHAVMLVAEEKKNNQCNVMIRNSYGSMWYPKNAIDCACRLKNGTYKKHCKKGESSEYVGCWFPKSLAYKHLGAINAVQ